MLFVAMVISKQKTITIVVKGNCCITFKEKFILFLNFYIYYIFFEVIAFSMSDMQYFKHYYLNFEQFFLHFKSAEHN